MCETLNPMQLQKSFKDVYGKYLLSFFSTLAPLSYCVFRIFNFLVLEPKVAMNDLKSFTLVTMGCKAFIMI